MHLDPMMMNITIVLSLALAIAYLAVRLGLPIVVAYILTGIMMGPSVLGIIDDQQTVTRVGEIGVVMLLFFVGMEVSIPKLMERWRIAVIGTAVQIAVSVGACVALVWAFEMPVSLGILFGFVISLSSTAVVLKELQDSGEMEEPFGQNAIGVLLVQDMAIVPMMIVLSLMGDAEMHASDLIKQIVGGIGILILVVYLMKTGVLHIPAFLKGSLEKRVLLGLLLCLGAATFTSWLGLSPGLGAFLAGMVLASSDQSDWVHEHLESVYVIFVMIFFLSVGMMVNVDYLQQHLWLVIGATMLVFLFNSGVNVFVMRALGEDWEQALITGGLLSQIGEFSFLLAAVGAFAGILSDDLHELTVIVIAMTLLFSPIWMMMTKRIARRDGVLPGHE
ncbi:monovalent cation:H+ antiporter-2, CPA2 family [Mariprofundus micogutta]|uniref:Monovalent cation:H+ antiporter-2, CPA2 family n=1 Tax=Mariprofundus micogutta TaxID=1921010 RepID=A0A1L8CMP1_9PROT|nr:cation:proton antiporter [Mariprofundus micogutta]GAV20109.1 monovalent cation:H+ antiporter-2, CPA2 family [Mariprofundus micogutta]